MDKSEIAIRVGSPVYTELIEMMDCVKCLSMHPVVGVDDFEYESGDDKGKKTKRQSYVTSFPLHFLAQVLGKCFSTRWGGLATPSLVKCYLNC